MPQKKTKQNKIQDSFVSSGSSRAEKSLFSPLESLKSVYACSVVGVSYVREHIKASVSAQTSLEFHNPL